MGLTPSVLSACTALSSGLLGLFRRFQETVWKLRISTLLGSHECSRRGQEELIRCLEWHQIHRLLSLLAVLQTVSLDTRVNRGRPLRYPTTSRWCQCSNSGPSPQRIPQAPSGPRPAPPRWPHSARRWGLPFSISRISRPGTPYLFESCAMLQSLASLARRTVSPNTNPHYREAKRVFRAKCAE